MDDELETELTETSLELLTFLEKKLDGFTARAGYHQRFIVGAFFARATSLLRTIDLLRQNAVNAGAGILVRSVFEADLLCLYVALGGEKEFNVVIGEFHRNVSNLEERNPEAEFSSVEYEWAFEQDHMHVEQVAKDLGPLLRAAGDKNGDALGMYDSLYRETSTFEAHGMGMTIGHVDTSDEEIWRVELRPRVGLSAARCLHLGAFYTAWCGQWAFDRLSLDRTPMIEFTQRLAVAMEGLLPPE